MKPRDLFLPRAFIVGPYLALCTTEEMFNSLLDYIDTPKEGRPKWVSDGAHATTHTIDQEVEGQRKVISVVCLAKPPEGITGVDIAALLVHEAVHVWQNAMANINEDSPSKEFEAYSIQAISANLMNAYVEQTQRKRK